MDPTETLGLAGGEHHGPRPDAFVRCDLARDTTTRFSTAVVVFCTSTAFFMITLDTSIVNLALPSIGEDFHIGSSGLQWAVESYVLVFASLLIGAGAIGDAMGAKRVFFVGLAIFVLASGLCSLASAAWMLNAARALQGSGAALLLPTSLALLSGAIEDPQRRVRAVSLWAGMGPVGLALGPLIGGSLVQLCGWRSIFAVNIPVGAVVAALVRLYVSDTSRPRRRKIDIVGQISLMAILCCVTFLLIEVPRQDWTMAASLCAGVLGVACAAFILAELRHPCPIVPFELMKCPQFSATSAAGMFHNIGIFGQIFALGLVFQESLDLTPFQAGLLFLPLTGALAVGTRVSAPIVAARGTAAAMTIGHCLAAFGAFGIAYVGFRRASGGLVLSMAVMGFGAGITTPAMNLSILDAAPKDRSGLASGILNTSRQIGTVVGVAVLGSRLGVPGNGADAPLAARAFAGVALLIAGLLSLCSSTRAPARHS